MVLLGAVCCVFSACAARCSLIATNAAPIGLEHSCCTVDLTPADLGDFMPERRCLTSGMLGLFSAIGASACRVAGDEGAIFLPKMSLSTSLLHWSQFAWFEIPFSLFFVQVEAKEDGKWPRLEEGRQSGIGRIIQGWS